MGNSSDKESSSEDDKSPSLKSTSLSRRSMRQRFYNAHHTWNEMRDGNGKDLMFEFIRNCHCDKLKEKNKSIFYFLIDKLLININKTNTNNSCNKLNQQQKQKKIIRSMRLIHAWMTLAINNNKYWIFGEMGSILKTMYDNINQQNVSRIIIDYERIMGDLLCLCTLKKRKKMIKYMVNVLQIDVNLSCEGGETPLIICAEHNFPEITLFLLCSGADANCNNYQLSDSSNSPAQISASWQHLKVLYYLIIYGANYNYYNIHLRSVKQYAKDNHLINMIVQKALNQKAIRNKNIFSILHKMLLHPIEYIYYFSGNGYNTPSTSDSDSTSQDFQFLDDDNVINFNINFGDNDHIHNQIKLNINKSREFIKKNKNKHRYRIDNNNNNNVNNRITLT
eukprot:381931_1